MVQRRKRNGFAAFRLGLVVAASWGVLCEGHSAWAQDASQTTDVSRENGGTQWALNCASQESGSQTDCQVSQIMTLRETGQRILMVVVKKQEQTSEPHVMLALPHKIYLPAGVIVQVDSQLPHEMDVETCDERACYASGAVTAAFLKNMQGGAAMHVTFQNLLRKPVTVSVPLSGFTPAYGQLQ